MRSSQGILDSNLWVETLLIVYFSERGTERRGGFCSQVFVFISGSEEEGVGVEVGVVVADEAVSFGLNKTL